MAEDRRLLYVLQRAARAALARANRVTVERLGVTAAQLGTLAYVAGEPGCAMTDIAGLLDLNKSAVSGMIARLERAGLLRRQADPDDRRVVRLYSTAKATALRARARPIMRRIMAELAAGFTPGEMDVVFRFLNAVAGAQK